MRRASRWAELILVAGLILPVPKVVCGEGFASLGLGGAITQDANINGEAPAGSVTVRGNFATSFTVDGRLGYWFEGAPMLGVAGSASYYQPDVGSGDLPAVSKSDVTVVSTSLLLMARAPVLTSNEFPNGQLQPYLGVGPGVFISQVSDPGFSDTSYDFGLDVRAGMSWLFTQHVGLFGEYRLTHVTPRFEDEVLGQKVHVEVPLLTHHFLAGAMYQF